MANPIFPQEANSSNENNLLKDWYTPERVRDLVYKKIPFTMMVRKNMDVSGRQLVVPQIYSDPQGTSNTFSNAQGNQFPLTAATFMQVPNQKYTLGSITGRLMRQSRDKEGAFLDLLKENIDKSLKTHMNRMHIDLVANNGSSALAQFSSITSTSVSGYTNVYNLQLTIVEQVRYFEVNARVTVGNTQNWPSNPATNSALGTIILMNRSAGVVTIAFDSSITPSGLQWLGFDGDYITNNSAQGATNWQGLAAWLPTVAARSQSWFTSPTQGVFNGVYRAQDSDRLAGVALNLAGSPVKSALIRLAAAIDVNGGDPDMAYMHNFDFASLAEALGPNVLYDNIVLSKEANISYRSIVLQTESGEVRIVQDPAVPRGTIYMLQQDTWELAIWGDLSNIVQDDGLTVLRGGTDDSVTWRARTFGCLTCHAVGFNGVVTI